MKVTELHQTVLRFSEHKDDEWKLRDATQGVQIFGSIGSGKSSGSGKFIALHYLKKGFGGIVLTGKIKERREWKEYAETTGRSEDMVYFGEDEGYTFNPLAYEMNRTDKGGGRTENIATLFSSLVKLGNRMNGAGGGAGSDDPFWDLALNRCIKATLDLLKLSKESLTVTNMVAIIRDAPEGKGNNIIFEEYLNYKNLEEELESMGCKPQGESPVKHWENNFAINCMLKASNRFNEKVAKEKGAQLGQKSKAYRDYIEDKRVFEITKQYFLMDFSNLPEKTRSSILEMFYAFANPFRAGLLAEYFSAECISPEIMPEETFRGKVIVIDFPVKEYLQLGIFAQSIYKKIWQQAVERRDVERFPTPVFMWIDEAQYFISEDDMFFQTTARSARACTVMITQNISNYYAAIGGNNAKERVDSLLGNLVTKIFHANNDYVTNEWAAKTISETYRKQQSMTAGEKSSLSIGKTLAFQVQPQEFTVLKNGGEENDEIVQAIITSTKTWSTGTNYLETSFKQNAEKKKRWL